MHIASYKEQISTMNKNAIAKTMVYSWLIALVVLSRAWAAPVVNIGIIYDGEWQRYQGSNEIIKKEILELTKNEFQVRFPADKSINGRWSYEEIKKGVDRLLADPQVNIVLALGTVASQEVSQRTHLTKPVIAPFVIDPLLQKLPRDGNKSGVKNLNYLYSPESFDHSLQVFHQVAQFSHLAILVNPLIKERLPTDKLLSGTLSQSLPVKKISLISVTPPVSSILNAIPKEVDAVMLTPLLELSESELTTLAQGLVARQIPSFSLVGRDEVDKGIMMSLMPPSDIYRMARRIALNVQRILLKEDAGQLETSFRQSEQLSINVATARAIEIWPSWSVLTEADLVHDEVTNPDQTLTLTQAIQRAVAYNLDLAASGKEVEVSRQDVRRAVANLLPQVEIAYQGQKIDRDRADASFGVQRDRETSGNITLTQPVFVESAWANLTIQERLRKAKELELEQTRLDITLDAAKNYLNVLRSKSSERIRKNNLKVTRSNLELANTRVVLGAAQSTEVYRWESEIANKQREVINAQSQTQQAFIALRRLLHIPQATILKIEETSLDDPVLIVMDKRLDRFLDNPWMIEIFDSFMVEEGLTSTPELKRWHEVIAAQERSMASAQRAFYVPEVTFQGTANKKLSQSDANLPNFPGANFDTLDKEEWSLGFSVKLPIDISGSKLAEYRKSNQELQKLKLQYESAREQVEERIRIFLYKANASYAAIQLAQKSAIAARKNLQSVADSYSKGSSSILNLLDAQDTAFAADENAANAVYDFLIDLMEVQRAIGKFDFFASKEDREQWFKRLEAYFAKQRQQKRKAHASYQVKKDTK